MAVLSSARTARPTDMTKWLSAYSKIEERKAIEAIRHFPDIWAEHTYIYHGEFKRIQYYLLKVNLH